MGSNAQGKPFRIGLKVSPSIDWASSGSTATKNLGIRPGLGLGVFGDYYVVENVGLSTGLNFNMMNMRYQFVDFRRIENFLEETQVPVERRFKAVNLEIPVKLKVKMDVVDFWKVFVEAGVGMSFNLKDKGKDKYDAYGISFEDTKYVDYSYEYRMFQASIIFGMGAEYELNRNLSLFAQATFNHGLSNMFVKQLEKQTGSILNSNFIGIEIGVLF